MAHIRFLAIFLVVGSEALVLHWLLLAMTGAGLSPLGAILWMVALAAANVAFMAGLMRFARRAPIAHALSRVWMVGSLGALFSGPPLLAVFLLVGAGALLARSFAPSLAGAGDTALIAGGGLAVAVGFGSMAWGWLVGQRRVEVERIDLPMPNLPPSLSGIRVAHITDLHIGPQLRAPRLARLVEHVNETEPDLIVITGDIFDFDASFIEEGCRELSKLYAPNGVFAVLGNHDVYTGVDAVVAGLERFTSIEVLRDAWRLVEIEGGVLVVAGIEDTGDGWRDKECRSPELERLAKEIPEDVPTILLIHRPSYFGQAAELGFPVSLAGHTHGGQISLPPPAHHHNISRLIAHWTRGMFADESGDSILYVSRGIGVAGPPVRLNCAREIALHRLVPRR